MARHFILKDGTLRLGSFSRTNDLKESKEWEFNLATYQNRDLGAYNFKKTSEWFSAALKSTTKLACFSLDRPPLSGDHTRDILNRGLAKPRMWAQYSENHTGVCLVFDKAKLLDAVRSKFQTMLCLDGPVEYRNPYIVRSLEPHELMIDVDLLERLGPKIMLLLICGDITELFSLKSYWTGATNQNGGSLFLPTTMVTYISPLKKRSLVLFMARQSRGKNRMRYSK